MEKEKPGILLTGAGAVGGIIAALLAKNNHAPDVIVKYPELKKIARTEGFRVKGYHGEFSQRVNALLPSDLHEETYSIVLVGTKATDMAAAVNAVLPHIEKDALVVSLQNGMCEDALAELVGPDRTVGCVVGWGATMDGLGSYDMTSGGEFVIGAIGDVPRQKIEQLRDILSCVVPVRISENIYGSLYSKLIINSCITIPGAISGLKLGEMLSKRKFRNIFIGIMKEAMLVANAMNIKVEPYLGKINFYRFIGSDSFWAQLKRHLVIRVIGFKFRKLKSSSLQSLERGKPTEIDFFNGYISRKAAEYRVKTPLNDKLTGIIKEIESGERKIGLENFRDKFFDSY
jgi:2-dehydropantoate 2-reductase